jgi:hypothetical protein
MKTKTVERLLQETPQDVKKSVSDYADALIKTEQMRRMERVSELQGMAEQAWEGCDGCTEQDKDIWVKGYMAGALRILSVAMVTLLIGCSPKVTQDLYWVDQYGERVPIIVTIEKQDTVYDFGTIIMYPADTTSQQDTINEIRH